MLSRLVMLLAGLFFLLLITQKVKESFENEHRSLRGIDNTCNPCPQECSFTGPCVVQTEFCYKNSAGNWCTRPDNLNQLLQQPPENGVITSAL